MLQTKTRFASAAKRMSHLNESAVDGDHLNRLLAQFIIPKAKVGHATANVADIVLSVWYTSS